MNRLGTGAMVRALMMAIACGVAGCSGGDGGSGGNDGGTDNPSSTRRSIGGTIQGNVGSVTMRMNGQEQNFTGSTFTFTPRVEDGEEYTVTFVSESTGLVCTVFNSTGIAVQDVTNILVNCSAVPNVLRYDDIDILGGLATGDFNGDGRADLVVTLQTLNDHPQGGGNLLARFLYGADGGAFVQGADVQSMTSILSKRGRIEQTADLNNDGFDDYMNAGLRSFLGNAGMTPTQSYTASTWSGEPIELLDVTGDGITDMIGIVFGGSVQHFLGLRRGVGDGTFGAVEYFAPQALTLPSYPNNFTTGDFNGDGHADIIVVGTKWVIEESGAHRRISLGLLRGDSTGSFAQPDQAIFLSDDLIIEDNDSLLDIESQELAAGDFNEDGHLDVALTSSTNFLQVILGDGAGNFTQSQRVRVGRQPHHVRVHDFNQDGHADLLSANATTRTLHINYGNGDGSFSDESTGTQGWISIFTDRDADFGDVAVADFDLDGYPDIALAEGGTAPEDLSTRGSLMLFFSPGRQ